MPTFPDIKRYEDLLASARLAINAPSGQQIQRPNAMKRDSNPLLVPEQNFRESKLVMAAGHLLARARKAIDAEAASAAHSAQLLTLPFARTEQTQSQTAQQDTLSRALSLVQAVHNAYAKSVDSTLESVQPLLRPFRGVPTEVNVLSIFGVEDLESVFQRILHWLLLPNGTHRLNDRFLRRFLARAGIDLGPRMPRGGWGDQVAALLEFQWRMPESAGYRRLDAADPGRSLRVDVLVAMPGLLVPIEVKVDAEQSRYALFDKDWLQAAAYVTCLKRAAHVSRHGEQRATGRDRDIARSISSAVKSHTGSEVVLQAERVIGVIVHHEGQCSSKDESLGRRQFEHGEDVRHISWLDVCDIISKIDGDIEVPLPTRQVLRSFQSSILRNGSGRALMEAIDRLRLLCDERSLAQQNPIQAHDDILRLRDALHHRDECCASSRRGALAKVK